MVSTCLQHVLYWYMKFVQVWCIQVELGPAEDTSTLGIALARLQGGNLHCLHCLLFAAIADASMFSDSRLSATLQALSLKRGLLCERCSYTVWGTGGDLLSACIGLLGQPPHSHVLIHDLCPNVIRLHRGHADGGKA